MRNKINQNTYVIARYAAFFIASIASALFNIFLFTSLDRSWWYLLLAMSIALEGAKLTTVISKNVSEALYLKTGYKKLKSKANRLFTYYLIYGVLSIVASLGFSMYVTAQTQEIQSVQLTTLNTYQTSILDKMSEIEAYKQSQTITSYLEYQPYIDQGIIVQQAQEQVTDLTGQRNNALETARNLDVELNAMTEEDTGYAQVRTRDQQAWNTYTNLNTQLRTAQADLDAAKLRQSSIQTSFESSKTDYQGGLDALTAELQSYIRLSGVVNEDGSIPTDGKIADILIKAKMQDENLRILREEGMSYMFTVFSDYTNGAVPAAIVKLIILMFASFLLELTVYQCAPDVKITKSILKYFKRSLPENMTFAEIVKSFDDEEEEVEAILHETPIEKANTEQQIQMIDLIATIKEEQAKSAALQEKLLAMEQEKIEAITAPVAAPPRARRKRTPKPKIETPVIEEPIIEDPIEAETYNPAEDPEATIKEISITPSTPEIIDQIDANILDVKAPEQEEEVIVEEPKVGPYTNIIDSISDTQGGVEVTYRFGKTTKFVADKFAQFVHALVVAPGKETNNPAETARILKFNDKTRDIFIDRLTRLNLGSKPLMEVKNGRLYANFSAERIADYALDKITK